MATLEQEEQRLFEEALRAALASEEIQAGVGLTTITEGEFRARADETKEEIWRRVQRERQQFRDLSEQVAALERRLADRRGAAEPRDRPVAELQELAERLRQVLNVFDEDPVYWETGANLQGVRDLLVKLSRLLQGELLERLRFYREDFSKLVESRDRAIDAVDIAIRLQRAEEETQESEGRTNLDRLTQLRAGVRGAAAQVRDLSRQLEYVLSLFDELGSQQSGLGSDGAEDSELRRLRDELIAAREALVEALTYAILRVLRVMLDERQAAGERQTAKERLDPEEGELFDRLSPSSREAVSRADGIRLALGQDRVHMEHLVFGLFEKEGGPTQRILREAEIDERKLRELIATATKMTIPMDYKPAELTALPPVSRHVQEALIAAQRAAGPDLSEPVRSHQLLFGALSVTDCSLIKLLVEQGVNRDSIELDRRQPSAGGADPASADTRDVLEAAPAEAKAEGTPIPATSGTGPVRAGSVAADYSADTFDRTVLVEGDTDTLGIRGDVDVLSSVIASARIHPPLSLGIFGDWGAGKSFLMNQLRLRVAQLASRARSVKEQDEAGSYYCSDIVQIEFNAWQYAGGELWASLINRVFEGIRDHLGSDEQYRKVIDEIERQDETVREAARRLAEAEKEVSRAVSPAARRTVAEIEADHPELTNAASSFANTLGLKKDEVDLIDVAVRTRELHTLAGRLREGWSRQGLRGQVVLLSVLAIGVVLLGAATALPSVAGALAAIAGVLTPALAFSASILKPTGDALRAGLRILDAGDMEKQRYAESKAAYEEAREGLERLRRQGPGGLYGFVEDRYRAEDYRKALGMVSLIREDLRRLTTYTTSQPGVPGIERVVLYIDDLDRCPSQQVVRVLEALNLLFGFPLFVVVIAVDSRWLIRSLEESFSGVFGAGQTPAPTPQDYLEKVIQIPFWLQPMRESGFGRLMSTLARPPAPRGHGNAGRSTPTPVETPSRQESVGPTSPATVGAAPAEPVETTTTPAAASLGPDGGEGAEGHEGTSSPAPPEPEAGDSGAFKAFEASDIDPRPERLVITDTELEFLRKLAPLVDTPRAAKRLLNTYQLVRVSVEDVPQFLERSAYEPLLVLLALVTSSPGLTASMVRSVLGSGEPDLPSFLENLDAADDTDSLGWMRLRDDLSRCPCGSVTAAAMRQWLPVVSRFSFQPGLAQLGAPHASLRRYGDVAADPPA